MKTLKYILVFFFISFFFLGCADSLKNAFYNQEGDRSYYSGEYTTSVDYYNKAAANGDGYAYYRLFEIYNYGKTGVPKNKFLADKMIKKAVELGEYRAEYIYALKFLYSSRPDYKKAIGLLESASRKEYPYAYLELGHVYLYGLGVKKNKVTAASYYRLANSFGLKTPNVNTRTNYKVKSNRSVLVSEIQSNLKKLGFYKSRVDGISGPMTRNSISSFQKYYGYEITGKVSKEVLDQTKAKLQ